MANNSKSRLKFVQINLHKSKIATQQLILNLESNDIDIALVQEPHVFRGGLPGFPGSYRIFFDTRSQVVKAAIIVRTSAITVFSDIQNCDYNAVTVDVSLGGFSCTLLSYYFEPSVNIDSDLRKIDSILSNKASGRILWSMDANSKSEVWFSPSTDSRGVKLSDFFSAWQLFVLNEDCGPTFQATQGSSYIDVTVVGQNIVQYFGNWCIPDCDSLSDHRMISFDMDISNNSKGFSDMPRGFNIKRANWNIFRDICSSAKESFLHRFESCTQLDILESCVCDLQDLLVSAAEGSIPKKRCGVHSVPWWSMEISCMRKQLNAARRRYQRARNITLREIYRKIYLDIRVRYSATLRESKLSSWREFLSDITPQNVWKKIYTYGVKTNFAKKVEISGIQTSSGNFTTTFKETIDVVMGKSFPRDSPVCDTSDHRTFRQEAALPYNAVDDVPFSKAEVDYVIENLVLNKTPGADRIANEMIKNFHMSCPSVLLALFNACLNLGVFPGVWKNARVILLPKSSELSKTHIDNIRCISLLPCLGKCLEKLCMNRLNYHLRRSCLLDEGQYGFTPQKSAEDAIISACDVVKQGKRRNCVTFLIFMDIKGAFDYAWWPGILHLLRRSGVPKNIYYLLKSFFQSRTAELTLGNVTERYELERGCPQGSVTGPFVWNLIMNDLLCNLSKFLNCYKIAFADDLLLIVQGKRFNDVCALSQDILNYALEWSRLFKLEFNPSKTKVMMIYKKTRTVESIDLTLGNVPIEEVQQMRYLGIIVDNKLQWKQHITYVSNKVEKALLGFLRVSKNVFGVNTDVLRLVYNQGIVPIISYASGAWGNSLKKKINSKLLRRIQRRFLLRIIRGYRTVSYDALYAISGLPPIDLIILNDIEVRSLMSSSHLSNSLDGRLPISSLPHPSSRKPVTVVKYDSVIFEEYKMICFTDGSKLNGRVGLAFVVYENGMEKETIQYRIPDDCSVFQAELLCLNLVTKWIHNFHQRSGIVKYLICTDSLSSLFLLRNPASTEKLVVEIHSILCALENNVEIHFSYIRGHSGNVGNERADELAKQATRRKIDLMISTPASHWKLVSKEKTIMDWNNEYLASSKAQWTKRFFPTILHRLKCKYFSTDFKLSQALTGHGNFKGYLFRFGILSNGRCDCGDGEENVEHVLMNCDLHANSRTIFRGSLESLSIRWPPVLSDLVRRKETFVILSDFIYNLNF